MARVEETMVQALKNVNFDVITLDDAVSLAAHARALAAEFTNRHLDVPEWLDTKSRELTRFIDQSVADQRDKRVRELKAQLSGLETPSEKRERIKAELERLAPAATV